MARDYEGQVTFLSVGGFDDADALQTFVDEHELHHLTHLVSEDGELFVDFELSYHPAWVMLDPRGEVVLSGVRPSEEEVHDALDALAGS